jgi:small-conductance mechanosensitive channel
MLLADGTLPEWTRDTALILEKASLIAIALAATWLSYVLLSRGLSHAQRAGHVAEPIVRFLRRLLRIVATVAAVLLLFQVLGVLESALAALAAMLAMIAIGFVAVWSVASNFLCSLILLLARPFRVGDSIALPPDPVGGRVVNFNMLYTTLRTDDGAVLHVPNNMFFQRVVQRWPGTKQIELQEQLPRPEDADV